MSFAVDRNHDDYLHNLEERAQRLLELASEMSSSSSQESRRAERSRRRPNAIRPNIGRQQGTTVSRNRLDVPSSYQRQEYSGQKTFPEREAAERIYSRDQRIEELEHELMGSRANNRRLEAEVKTLRAQLESRSYSAYDRIDTQLKLEEELEKFKETERQRLRSNLQQEVEHWAAKVKQTEKKYRGELDSLRQQLQRKDEDVQKYQSRYERQRRSHRKLLEFVKRQLPRINEQLARGIELVEEEIVHRTNPQLD